MARISVQPPGGEPFFDELQRLQPDIDVVLLPQASPVPAAPPASPARTVETVERVLAVTDELLLGADLQPTVRSDRWERASGGEQRFVARVSVRNLDAESALGGLRRLRDLVLSRGWDARPVDSPQPRMTATSADQVSLEASCTDTSVDLAVRSPLLVPDPATPREGGSGR